MAGEATAPEAAPRSVGSLIQSTAFLHSQQTAHISVARSSSKHQLHNFKIRVVEACFHWMGQYFMVRRCFHYLIWPGGRLAQAQSQFGPSL